MDHVVLSLIFVPDTFDNCQNFPVFLVFRLLFRFCKTKPSRILQVFSSLSKMASLSLDVIAQVVLAAETALPHWALAVKREKISIKYHCLHMILWFPRISFLIKIQCWHLTILTNCQKIIKFSHLCFDRFWRICTNDQFWQIWNFWNNQKPLQVSAFPRWRLSIKCAAVVLWSSKLFWLPKRPCLIWLFILAENMNANLAHVNTAAFDVSSVVSEILAHRREFFER